MIKKPTQKEVLIRTMKKQIEELKKENARKDILLENKKGDKTEEEKEWCIACGFWWFTSESKDDTLNQEKKINTILAILTALAVISNRMNISI